MHNARTLPALAYGEFSRRVHMQATGVHQVTNAQLELTYRCNLHCRHCYTDPYNHRDWVAQELSFSEIIRVIDDMAEIGILWLNLTGGEVFQHPRFWDIYEHAYRRGFLLQLYTNGTLFTDAVVTRLQAQPPFTIDISCHAVDESSFDWFTQVPGSFRAFRRGLELLRQADLPFTLKTKGMNWNRQQLPAIKYFVESFGQPFSVTTTLSPRLDGDLSSLSYRMAPADVATLQLDMMGGTPSEEECRTAAELLQRPADRLYRCGCGTNTIHINARGELGTCTLQYERRYSLRTYSLRDAIERLFQDIDSLHYTSDVPCRTCKLQSFCDKKPTEAHRECGSPDAPIPYNCDVAVARAELATNQRLIHPLRVSR
jgi:radical SAM protein with 4Fe4S-binding SPASM domain